MFVCCIDCCSYLVVLFINSDEYDFWSVIVARLMWHWLLIALICVINDIHLSLQLEVWLLQSNNICKSLLLDDVYLEREIWLL